MCPAQDRDRYPISFTLLSVFYIFVVKITFFFLQQHAFGYFDRGRQPFFLQRLGIIFTRLIEGRDGFTACVYFAFRVRLTRYASFLENQFYNRYYMAKKLLNWPIASEPWFCLLYVVSVSEKNPRKSHGYSPSPAMSRFEIYVRLFFSKFF